MASITLAFDATNASQDCAMHSRDTDFVDDIQYAGARLMFVRIGDYCSSKNLKEDIADS